MTNKQITFLVFTIFYFTSSVHAESLELSKQVLAPFYQSDTFLTQLGFKDYVGLAEDTLDKNDDIHPVSKLVLEKNLDIYAPLQSAKYIGNLTYAFLVLNESLPVEQRNKNIQTVINIATQQIAAFPLIGLEPVQGEEYRIARGKNALEIRTEYLTNRAVTRHSTEKQNLIKSFTYLYQQLEAGPTKSVAVFQTWIDRHLNKALLETYTMSNTQQNRYLGRAIVSVLVKYARDKKYSALEARLSSQLQTMDIVLTDLVSGKYTAPDKQPSLQLKSGDIALEFSNGQDAFFTSVGVKPTSPENLKVAQQFNLISSYSNIPVFISQEYYNKALDKKKSNLVLNETEEKILVDFWNPKISKGYSHAGIVEVNTDKETGISLAWVRDIYPKQGIGGVRLMTPEGFAYPERYVRLGFARYNPEKVLQAYKQQIETRGYKQYIMDSNESQVLINPDREQEEPYLNKAKRHKWPSKISKNEVDQLIQKASSMTAQDWYQNEFLPKVFQRLDEYASGKDALAFSFNFENTRSMAYCSQLVRLAFLQATNFDPVSTPDKLRSLPEIVAKYYPEKVAIDTEGGFVSPSGLVWQSSIIENHVHYNFSRQRAELQNATRTFVDHYTNYLGHNITINAIPLVITPQTLDPEDAYIDDDLSL